MKASQLTREGIESNPGLRNHIIEKAALISYHQGDSRYGDSSNAMYKRKLFFKLFIQLLKGWHCVKSVRIRSYSGPYFPHSN